MLRPALAIAKEKLLEAGYLNAPAGVILFSRHEDGHRYGLVEKEYEDSRGRVYPFPSFPTGTTDVTVVGTDGQEIMRCSLNKPRKQMRFLNESTLIPAKHYKRELARLEELADVNNRQVFDQEFVALLVRHFGEEAVRVE